MVTAEPLAPARYVSQVDEAVRRYENRTGEREQIRRTLRDQGVLFADTPERVTKRLGRLGADWSLATALDHTAAGATTGRSLGELAPDSFGAGVLGLERLMGRNDLIDAGFLEAGCRAARPVGRVAVRGPEAHYGTGFMVSGSLMMTNNHVLRSQEEADRGVIEFNYQAGADGLPMAPVVVALEPLRFFATDEALDFTVVAVADRSRSGEATASFGRLPLREAQGKVILGELVNIVQHPGGEPKQLALRENRVVDLLEHFVHYETDTAPGSSGSPVFNDQWEVVALHHAGVPSRDEHGRYLTADGSLWSPDMGEDRLAWKANEGVRISRVLQALREAPLTGVAAELRAHLFESALARPQAGSPAPQPQPQPQPGTVSGAGPETPVAAVSDGVARLTVPLQITVAIALPPAGAPTPAVDAVAGPPAAPVRSAGGGASPADSELQAALVDLAAGRARPYYDAAADDAARDAYYASAGDATGSTLRHALTALLERTHQRRPAYKPMRLLYPWVDLHPDQQLRSIYSGRTAGPEEYIRADAAVEAARFERWQELLLREAALGPDAFAAELEALEASLPFNCEHVVPQSWFGKREPMRGDLHHLFACEPGCNSFRGNTPYVDFTDVEEVTRTACGRREADGFEPSAGKGAAARATLYFLLRYPGHIGDASGELPPERLDTLLSWHETEPVTAYEHHRNAAIGDIQGNRNPLIDHPEWARALDFTAVWP
jgi:endonuclease I/V8-like Glu-specific endopeptidase